jgi:hypothetical protein
LTGANGTPKCYSTSGPWDFSVSATVLDRSSIALFYWTPHQQVGKGLIYNFDDFYIVPETYFKSNGATPSISAITLKQNIFIAYRDDSDQFGKFRVLTDSLLPKTSENIFYDSGAIELTPSSSIALDSNSVLIAYTAYGGASFIKKRPITSPCCISIDNIYPNPFSLSTSLRYIISQDSRVNIYVCDIKGRCVRIFYNGMQRKGTHTINWDGKQQSGQLVNPGVYLIKLEFAGRTISRTLIFAK